MEFTCPDCGLVIEASERHGSRRLAAHQEIAHHPAVLTCGACGLVIEASWDKAQQWMTEHREMFHPPQPVEQLRAIAQDLATGHKWRNTLSVADCEFLHALEIDPT